MELKLHGQTDDQTLRNVAERLRLSLLGQQRHHQGGADRHP